ncbi:MAG: lamin tail domain-containing protein [Kiritimatiellae bacterium]|nr:lamin tail domain-containing protein [Kiritimatiellia bacterium]
MIINEFMAANDTTLKDENGDYSDWVELYNAGSATVNMDGWQLRDSGSRWTFPAVNMAPGAYLLVFASGKDRSAAGAQLHTDFKLEANGEYLALVDAEGTIVTKFAPYPPQAPDVSYGIGTQPSTETVLPASASCRWHVPAGDTLGTSWVALGFSDGAWTSGKTGVGYEAGSGYESLIGADVQSVMYNKRTSVFLRVPFNVPNPSALGALTLKCKYEDGFVAYLNGTEVARANASGAPPAWDAAATAVRPDDQALQWQHVNLADDQHLLVAGGNVLAVHVLNDSTTSSDLLFLPVLEAAGDGEYTGEYRYFNKATPLAMNGTGTLDLGPIVKNVGHTPAMPRDADDLWVTAQVFDTGDGIASVKLSYKKMWDASVSVTMADDGAHRDGAAGDGLYGAKIPASAATVGQMVRYCITATDGAGHASRYPIEDDTIDYLGTVITDAALTSAMPIYHLFFQNPNWYLNSDGSGNKNWQTGCFYYNGDFYDKIRSHACGRTTLSSTYSRRKDLTIDFNKGHFFRYSDAQAPVEEFRINCGVVQELVANEFMGKGGVPASIAFPVHIRMNGSFWDLRVFIEEGGRKEFVDRNNLSPDGSSYKGDMGPGACLRNRSGFIKKTGDSSWADFDALTAGLQKTDAAARARWMFDNLDVAAIVNYHAMCVVVSHIDRPFQNYYVYRDGTGKKEWLMWAFDLDYALNTYGADGKSGHAHWDPMGSHPYFADRDHMVNPAWGLDDYYNRMADALYRTAETREMFQRHLRTMIDKWLKAPSPIEERTKYWAGKMGPEASLSVQKWPKPAGFRLWTVNEFKNDVLAYIPRRRDYLYAHSAVPAAQPSNPSVNFGTVDFRPASGNQDEEYIELTNPNAYAVDIGGWRLANAVEFTFRPGTVIRAGHSMYVSPNVVAFRARASSPKGNEGRFVQGHYKGQLSAWGETIDLWNDSGVKVKTKTYSGTPSSPQQYLRISELMYNPDAGEDYEFIELKNTRGSSLDIANVKFTDGIEFTFPAGTTLAAGEYIVVVRNKTAFQALYGTGVRVAGQYQGALDNGGEELELRDAYNEKILAFAYKDGWFASTDGDGFSLVMKDLAPHDAAHWENRSAWRASYTYGGSPGKGDVDLGIVINEVLTHTDPPLEDAVEIRNVSSGSVDISGWYLSDELQSPKKYRVPNGTVLPAGGYTVLYEYQFNPTPADPACFALSSHGEKLWLSAANSIGTLTGYRAFADFGAALNGVSFGRYVRSDGEADYPAMKNRTFGVDSPASLAEFRQGRGKTNSGPAVGPVVINEIMYHPAEDGDEFIELLNVSGSTVTLFDPANPLNRWKLTGAVDFVFPPNSELGAGQYALVVGGDPAAFRAKYGIGAGVQIFGPWLGALDNAGEGVRLRLPDAPDPEAGYLVPYPLVDQVRYDNKTPWPESPDGGGPSLERLTSAAYGNDPANWSAGGVGGTPGRANDPSPEPPAAPSALVATAVSGSRVDLGWHDNSGNEAGFKIDRRLTGTSEWVRIATLGPDTASYSDSGLPEETTFYYQVKAYNGAGSSAYTAVAGATTLAGGLPPAAPSGVTAAAQSSSEIMLAWTDNSDNESGFKIDRRQSGTSEWGRIATLGAGTTRHTDTGLPPETKFYYVVKAYNTDGDSADSNVGEATTPAMAQPPAAPGSLSAVAVSWSAIQVMWADNSDDETGFKIDRRQSGTDEWVRIATLGAGTTTHTDPGLSAQTKFYYMVKAYNAAGNSAYTAVAAATTPDRVQPPAAPSGLNAQPASHSQIALQWIDNSNNETGFKIERRQSGAADWVPLGPTGADVVAYTDAGLPAETKFYYRLWAFNSAGNSATSEVAYAATAPQPAAAWRYCKGTAEASASDSAWRLAGFDDSGWDAAVLPVGYGSEAYGTTLGDMRGRYSCVLLRSSFEVACPEQVTELNLAATFDDGFIVWINGEEVARVNMPGTPGDTVPYDGFAAVTTNAAGWSCRLTGPAVPPLCAGSNALAVQLFNATLDSGDLLFDLDFSLGLAQLALAEDADQDALPDDWEQHHFAGIGQPTDADPDGDGFSNIEEYVAGTDPNGKGSCFRVDVRMSSGHPAVSFATVAAAGTGYTGLTRHYALEECVGANAAWLSVSGHADILGAGQTVSYAPPAQPAGQTTLYRVRVWLSE